MSLRLWSARAAPDIIDDINSWHAITLHAIAVMDEKQSALIGFLDLPYGPNTSRPLPTFAELGCFLRVHHLPARLPHPRALIHTKSWILIPGFCRYFGAEQTAFTVPTNAKSMRDVRYQLLLSNTDISGTDAWHIETNVAGDTWKAKELCPVIALEWEVMMLVDKTLGTTHTFRHWLSDGRCRRQKQKRRIFHLQSGSGYVHAE